MTVFTVGYIVAWFGCLAVLFPACVLWSGMSLRKGVQFAQGHARLDFVLLYVPLAVVADRGYDSPPHQRELRRRGIDPVIAKRGTGHGSGLGALR